MTTSHPWQFAPRFRRNAFGWQSDTPIQRIKEALAEIKAVAKKEPVVAAEGAVRFLEKLSPAIAHVDSSSGRIGSAVGGAIAVLVPIRRYREWARGHWSRPASTRKSSPTPRAQKDGTNHSVFCERVLLVTGFA
jgi:hypothetical protein